MRWRGAFGIHSWIPVKRAGADRYTTHQIMDWRVRYGGDALVTGKVGAPDRPRHGPRPPLLTDHRGAAAEAMIDRVEAVIAHYPWGRPLSHRQGRSGRGDAVGLSAQRHVLACITLARDECLELNLLGLGCGVAWTAWRCAYPV